MHIFSGMSFSALRSHFITVLLCFVDNVKKGYDSEKFNIALGEGTNRDFVMSVSFKFPNMCFVVSKNRPRPTFFPVYFLHLLFICLLYLF